MLEYCTIIVFAGPARMMSCFQFQEVLHSIYCKFGATRESIFERGSHVVTEALNLHNQVVFESPPPINHKIPLVPALLIILSPIGPGLRLGSPLGEVLAKGK